MRILVTDGMDKSAIASLRERGHEVIEQFYEPTELGEALKDVDVVVVRSKTKVRKEHIDAAKNGKLKCIIRGGIGIDNIDADYARMHGIQVRNTPDASTESVAELALAHMLACARYVSISGSTMRNGQWEKKSYGKGIELVGKRLGIYGYGRIGKRLGVMAKGMGMNVLAYRRSAIPESIDDAGIIYVDEEKLLRTCDFISVHAPSSPAGPIITADKIAQMKDGVVIINTSRGANVDEKALLDALNSGKVRAAGLDVWMDEPTHNQELINHPNVSCTPHIGAATVEAQKRIGAEIVYIISCL
ncbi:MAG: D-2-hydroxyacid dehydrogenase [Oscillospiraceae bacterium]|nr:D-2-hydroxyacid dehydrogenase [Oscillospiraceae bacterium]